jgi:hypothetical protein
MRRRSYCAVVGCLLTGVAGCSGLTGNQSETETPTPPATTTSTPEGEPELSLEELSVPVRVEQPNADVPIRIEVQNTGSVEGIFSRAIRRDILDDSEVELEPAEIELTVPSETKATKEINLDVTNSGFVEIRVRPLERELLVAPQDAAPRIRAANLLTGWSQFGDVVSNSIQEVQTDTDVALGVRYDYWHTDGTHDAEFTSLLFDSEGNQLDVLETELDRITEDEGWGTWEQFLSINSGATPGEYTAELRVRDRRTGETSQTSIEFTVTE